LLILEIFSNSRKLKLKVIVILSLNSFTVDSV
jgi:hypothetical protein